MGPLKFFFSEVPTNGGKILIILFLLWKYNNVFRKKIKVLLLRIKDSFTYKFIGKMYIYDCYMKINTCNYMQHPFNSLNIVLLYFNEMHLNKLICKFIVIFYFKQFRLLTGIEK